MIALGVLAAVTLMQRRVVARGVATAEDITHIATWAVPAGVIGARLYHVITDWELFSDDPTRIVKIWQGGLGIPGGLLAGVGVGVWRARARGLQIAPLLDCAAPALALAQAIGRLGNWWNQELFGRPSTLPWALEIDPNHRPVRYADVATFHPTFLYESLWNLALCGVLIWMGAKVRLRAGRLFAVYVAGYCLARFFIEGLRVDPAKSFAGLRLNQWTSLVVFAVAAVFLVIDRVRLGPSLSPGDLRAPAVAMPLAPNVSSVPTRITPSDVAHVAKLARLDLDDEELGRYTHQLADMLDHFADVDALDLAEVEPMTQPYPLVNVLRPDEVKPGVQRDEVLAAAPAAEANRFKVPSILGDVP